MVFLLLLPVVVSGFSQTYYPMPEYKFSWTADLATDKLHTEVVLTPPSGQPFGWIGFGIAGGAGGMLGGDVFTAYWTNTSTCAIQDRRASSASKSRPPEDISNNGFADWTIDSCSLTGSVFTIAATRAFVTFDDQDLDFVTGPMTLLFAWGKTQPSSPSTLSFHDGGFAPKELSLWGEAVVPFDKNQLESDYDVVELKMPNVSIGNHTSYTCFGFNLDLKNNSPTQAVAFEALINPANLKYVHHIIVYACSLYHNETFDCVTMPASCQSGIMYAWGVGGNPFVLPPVTGLDIAITGRKFVAMQMHYNNPGDVQNLIDNSGVAIYRTNQLRPNRTQFFFTGSLKLNLPYGKTQVGVAGHCNETLGKTSWPASGVNVYSTMVHAHQRGRRLWTVLMRNGTFVTTIGNNQAYDFNLQKTVSLTPHVKVYPGDQLFTYCVWDTSKDTQNVTYGEKTENEMCINFLAFYPAYTNTSHITCGVNTNPYQATNPGPNSCVLLPDNPPAAYTFTNWTISDYYYMAGGVSTCTPGFEGTAVLGCPGYGAPFSFSGCRRKLVVETTAPTVAPVADSAFVPAVSFAFAWLLLFV